MAVKAAENMVSFKEDLNEVLNKYGYNIRRYILDETVGRRSSKQASLELFLEPVDDQE
jgi:hypothetical protein